MRRTALAVVAVMVLAAGLAHAHHGYANFFMDRTVTVEGEIEEVRFANPHVVLRIRAADSTIYTALFIRERPGSEAGKQCSRRGERRPTTRGTNTLR